MAREDESGESGNGTLAKPRRGKWTAQQRRRIVADSRLARFVPIETTFKRLSIVIDMTVRPDGTLQRSVRDYATQRRRLRNDVSRVASCKQRTAHAAFVPAFLNNYHRNKPWAACLVYRTLGGMVCGESMAVNVPQGIRTLRLKVKTESYPWLNAAAVEINQVWNWANTTSDKAARPFAGTIKWLKRFVQNLR
jgi:hypothetical protein